MAGILHAYIPNRVIDSNGISDGASIAFYLSGTTTPAPIYSNAGLSVTLANPVVVPAGAAVPDIYLNPALTYRRVVTFSDGSTQDTDPYTGLSSGGISYERDGTGAVSRSLSTFHLESPIYVTEFGADPTEAEDSYDAIQAAIIQALASNKDVVFPDGNYKISSTLELAYPRLRVIGEGKAVIQAADDFTGSSVISLDATATIGEPNSIVRGGLLSNIMIRGNGDADQDGLYTNNVSDWTFEDIQVRNVTGNGFNTEGNVWNRWDRCGVSYRSSGAGPTEAKPVKGFYITDSASITSGNCVTMRDCIVHDATEHGFYLDDVNDMTFIGCGAEGLDGVGWYIGDLAGSNVFINSFSEANEGGDLDCYGDGNMFISCQMTSRAEAPPYTDVVSATFRSGARGNVITGGNSYYIVIASGALNTTIEHHECDHFISDSGTGTVISDCLQLFTSGTRFPSRTFGNIADPNPLAIDYYKEETFTVSFGGSTTDGTVATSTAIGRGRRIGNHFRGTITLIPSSITSVPTGNLYVRGLPYTVNGAQNVPVTIGPTSCLTYTGTLVGVAVGGLNVIRFASAASASAFTILTGSALGSGQVAVSFEYEVA